MLRWRLLLGVVFAALLAAMLVADHRAGDPGWSWGGSGSAPVRLPGVILLPLACLIALAAAQELLALMAARPVVARAIAVYPGTLLVVASVAVPLWWADRSSAAAWPAAALGLAIGWTFVVEMYAYRAPGGALERIALGILAISYSAFTMALVALLRLVGDGLWGVPAIVTLVLVVKAADIGAYTVGRLVGRHKMAPTLSPGKTWEGAGGALVFSALAAWLGCEMLAPFWTGRPVGGVRGGWLVYGLLLGVAGMVGDLAESLLKRDLGRKDSSTWMPGFGGVLDLLDSILLAAPVAYLCWESGLVGP